MKYKPFTTDSTKEIIKEIKNSLPNIEKSQITIDTLDICHLLGEIERLNNIINELRRMMFCNKMYCEKLFEESKLSREDFKQQHPYTLGSYDNSVNLLERLEELKEDK